MTGEVLGIAQIEIVASLDGLRAGLESARAMISETSGTLDSALGSASSQMAVAIKDAGQARDSWLSLGDAALRLAANVEKAILQLAIFDPLLNAMSGSETPLPSIGGGASADLAGSLLGLAGFADGGDFEVGGQGGIDSSLVAFRATPGERVSITPATDRGGSGAGAVTNVSIHNYSGIQAQVSHSRNSRGGRNIDVIIGEMNARDVRANGPLGQAIRQQYGAEPVPVRR
jgi:hypothetical protein